MVQKEEDGTRRTGWGGGIWGARVIEVVVGPGREQLGPTSLLPLHQEQAFETSQKYKEGKYIIEMSHMVKDNGWD